MQFLIHAKSSGHNFMKTLSVQVSNGIGFAAKSF